MTLTPGTRLNRYEILSKLGEGGMGEVFLAEDTSLRRKIAIKILQSPFTADDKARMRLVREAQAAAALDHPNICAIYEVGESDPHTFICMQYIAGETLETLITHKSFDLPEILGIGIQVADALAEAHARGIIHRDIKPGNIMITQRGSVKVMDFGLAKPFQPPEALQVAARTQTPGDVRRESRPANRTLCHQYKRFSRRSSGTRETRMIMSYLSSLCLW